MNYEQKFNASLEQAKKELATCGSMDCEAARLIFRLFPQLRESEDERIRIALCDIVRDMPYMETELRAHGLTVEKTLAYLEKQKELPFVKDIVPGLPGLYFYDGERMHFQGYPAKEENPYDFAMNQQEKQKEQKLNIELIQRSWYMEGYTDGEFKREPMWNLVTGKGGPKYEKNEKYGRPLEQKPTEKQDYSGLNDLERAILRDFLVAGVENVPVEIIKETAQECLAQMKPAEWSEEDEQNSAFIVAALDAYNRFRKDNNNSAGQVELDRAVDWLHHRLKYLRPQPKQERQITAGNIVSIHCRKDRKEDIITIYDGKVGEVIHVWDAKKNPWGHIVVRLDDGCNNCFYEDELEVLDESHWKPSEKKVKPLKKVPPIESIMK